MEEQKLRKDFDIKEKDNDPESLKKYNEAFLEMLNEEADIKDCPVIKEYERRKLCEGCEHQKKDKDN